MLMRPHYAKIQEIVRMALDEDAPWGDLTAEYVIPAGAHMTAQLVAREEGVLCGEDVFTAAMSLIGRVETRFIVHDGEKFAANAVLGRVAGPAHAILRAERVALNFTQRLSGIATLTARYVAQTAGTKARIVDTRKTTPGLRLLERYAVRCGGGHNHRFSLSDAVMVKDNHLQVLRQLGAHDVTKTLHCAFQQLPHTTHVEVEVDRLDQIESVLAAGVHTIMLDNFSIEHLRCGVKQIGERAAVEASGGVALDRVREIAQAGVDIISVGALTHSPRALDLGLDMTSR
jgi:nicotinate-nucleotide pyrophosphorylase (carboxylating)